jgi:hypothetical protein
MQMKDRSSRSIPTSSWPRIKVVDSYERLLGSGRFTTDKAGLQRWDAPPGLRVVRSDGELEALRMLTDRRDEWPTCRSRRSTGSSDSSPS